ncbi:unnamed protein product [Brassica napus]|uniref:(rape) hypothetical protein n=1 Tax=Brassica napus TaxID=3708 RepID=A0A816MF04_BRANA|nr:unnamed protein product [Brassica napus]
MGPEELKQKLEEETALNYISICSKNPLNGILRLHLPPNNTKMNVVLFPSSSSKATKGRVHTRIKPTKSQKTHTKTRPVLSSILVPSRSQKKTSPKLHTSSIKITKED